MSGEKEGAVRRLSSATGAAAREGFAGPRELGQIIPRLARPAFRKASPAAAQIMADWAEIAGPSGVLREAQPVRLSGGALTLACSGALALEISMLAPQVIERVNGHLGRAAVRQLRFVQASVPAPPKARKREAVPDTPLPDGAAAALATVPEGPLREALERLGRQVFTPAAKPVPLGPVAPVRVLGKVR
jgi:hypothetical protein